MAENKLMRTLITGATGLLGRALAYENRAAAIIDPVGTYYPEKEYPSRKLFSGTHLLDIRDRDEINRLVVETGAAVIINCASIAAVDYVEQHRDEVRDNNLAGTRNVVEVCRDRGIKMIHISTNAVYDGTDAPYAEDDTQNPLNYYGELKRQEDAEVAGILGEGNYAIVRPILMYGWNDPLERQNPLTWQLAMHEQSKMLKMVDDIYCNPLLANDCAAVILGIIRRNVWDVFNVGGPERMNRYEMARRIARFHGYNEADIEPVQNSFFATIAPRPVDTTLATGRAREKLGYASRTIEEGMIYLEENKF